MNVAFRCDGDARVGAGHVARCLQLALALRAGGASTVFIGTWSGVAADLLQASGLDRVDPGPGPLGAPSEADAVIVDSYEIPAAEIERAAAEQMVVALVDLGSPPAGATILSYHLDARKRIGGPGMLGPAYAPVAPAIVRARRPRGFGHALVTMGGGEAGTAAAERAARELLDLDPGLQITVAAPGPDRIGGGRVRWGVISGGLQPAIAEADVAISAAGSTPYDLAAAGVPAVLHAIAPNQEPVRRAFLADGLALEDAAGLAGQDSRAAAAAAGPARIDGYGAYRARDALHALVAGRPLPRVLTYRPATAGDADLLRGWRNDPVTREMSRSPDVVGPEEHRAWLRETLADPCRTLLVVERDGLPVGTLRFDRDGPRAEVSVALESGERGGGLGTQAIAEATELQLAAWPELEVVTAEVQRRNVASLRAFERAGYRMTAERAADEGSAMLTRAAGARRP